MIETNSSSTHLAGIIPVAGLPLEFNMPWHDCLMPINKDYHAIERAVSDAACAGCNTIWIVLHRETQPIIKKKVGEWVYDPTTTWIAPKTYWNKREIPIYYVGINPRDRNRRDSMAWSSLYGAKVASYVSKKISKWILPKKFLVISPYSVVDQKKLDDSRELLKGDNNIMFTHNGKSFIDNEYLPFTFTQEEYEKCRVNFREIYSGDDRHLNFNDIYKPIDLNTYTKIDSDWHYNISTWEGYRRFLGSEHNKIFTRPKYLVTHEWWGFIKDK